MTFSHCGAIASCQDYKNGDYRCQTFRDKSSHFYRFHAFFAPITTEVTVVPATADMQFVWLPQQHLQNVEDQQIANRDKLQTLHCILSAIYKKEKKKKEVANFLTAMHFSSVLVTFSPPSESRDLKTLQQNLTVHFHASSQIKIWLHISRQTCSEKSGTTYLCGWKTCPLATPRKIAPQESQGTRQTVHFLKAACVTIFHYVFLLVGPF